MKKLFSRSFVIVLALLCAGSVVFAAVISSPAATVNLTKNTAITTEELNRTVDEQKALVQMQGGDVSTVDPLTILNVLINNELWRQGAARDGVVITDAQINQYLSSWRAQLEQQQIGRALTTDEFNEFVTTYYGGMDNLRTAISEQLLVSAYISKVRPNVLTDVRQPSESEINSFYRQNKAQFVNPENVKLSHIYIPYATGDGADAKNAENKALMEQVARYINYGTTTFEKAVQEYSQDTSSKNIGGAIGWLTMDDTSAKQALGDNFFNGAFDTEVGKISPVIESNTGYHILKVYAHNDFKVLGIDDPINPETTATVRQYITETLISQNQQTDINNAINDILADLRKQATIRILYK
jgi:parvulin-like peptidyl-prolyl isomerase